MGRGGSCLWAHKRNLCVNHSFQTTTWRTNLRNLTLINLHNSMSTKSEQQTVHEELLHLRLCRHWWRHNFKISWFCWNIRTYCNNCFIQQVRQTWFPYTNLVMIEKIVEFHHKSYSHELLGALRTLRALYTHTHTHIYIYIYIYIWNMK